MSELSSNELYDSTLLVDREWLWALLGAAEDISEAALEAGRGMTMRFLLRARS